MKRFGLIEVSLSLALVSLSSQVHAQSGDPMKARALFDEATKALDQGDWNAACAKFDASFALKRTISGLLNIARCHAHSGKLILASDDYHRALTLNEDTVSQSRRKELTEFTEDALRTLETRIPKLRVILKDAPPGVRITLDGHALSAAALDIDLPVDPGEHVVVVWASGRKTETRRVTIDEGSRADIPIELFPDKGVASPPPPIEPATPTPAPAPAVAPVAPDRGAAPAQKSGVPAWAWVGGAAGIAFGGAAIAFAANGAGANCGGACTDDKFSQSDVDNLNARRHRDLALGLAFGGVGAIGFCAFGIGVATAPRAQSTTGFVVHPLTGSGVAGLGVRGGF